MTDEKFNTVTLFTIQLTWGIKLSTISVHSILFYPLQLSFKVFVRGRTYPLNLSQRFRW